MGRSSPTVIVGWELHGFLWREPPTRQELIQVEPAFVETQTEKFRYLCHQNTFSMKRPLSHITRLMMGIKITTFFKHLIFRQLMINVTIHTSFVWYHQNYCFWGFFLFPTSFWFCLWIHVALEVYIDIPSGFHQLYMIYSSIYCRSTAVGTIAWLSQCQRQPVIDTGRNISGGQYYDYWFFIVCSEYISVFIKALGKQHRMRLYDVQSYI